MIYPNYKTETTDFFMFTKKDAIKDQYRSRFATYSGSYMLYPQVAVNSFDGYTNGKYGIIRVIKDDGIFSVADVTLDNSIK